MTAKGARGQRVALQGRESLPFLAPPGRTKSANNLLEQRPTKRFLFNLSKVESEAWKRGTD